MIVVDASAVVEVLLRSDAAYVALAEALGAPLVTRDARLQAPKGSNVTIELI